MADNNDFTHEFQIYSTDLNAGTMGTGKFLLFDNNINAVKVESIDNIKIGGGEEGQVLVTDGEGNLTWATSSGGGGVAVNADWNSSSGASRILNKPDLTAYLPKSGGTLTGKLNAAQGAGTAGGYSFGGTEGANDTGMFSNADGVLDFYANAVKILTVTTSGVTSTEAITLPGNPTSNLQAATKQYVDGAVNGLNDFSGDYNDLTNTPTVASNVYIGTTQVAFNRASGNLTLTGVSIDGNAATVSNGVYTNGSYANPVWITSLAYSKLTDAPSLATVATSGSYADLTSKPTLATVATSGSYSDLTNRPSIFSGSYADLTNKPTLFDGAYLSLTGLPNFAAVATSGSYNDLINKPSIPDLTGYATEAWVSSQGFGSGSGSGVTSYNDLTNKPTLFSGDYNDLTNKPSIPSLDGYATEAWVNSQGFGSGSGTTYDQDLNTTNDVTFNKATITGASGIENADGQRITNSYYDGIMYVGSNVTQMPVSILMGGAGPRNEWAFTPDGKLTLPEVGTGLGWTNTDTAPADASQWLASSTISFDKNLGIVLNNEVGSTNHNWVLGKDGILTVPSQVMAQTGNQLALLYNRGEPVPGFDADVAALFLDGVGAIIEVTNSGTSHEWQFDADGNLTLPAGGDIKDSTGASVLGGGSGVTDQIYSGDYNVTVSESGVISMNTARGGIEFGAMPEVGGPTHLHIMRPAGAEGATDLYFGDDYNYVKMPSSSYSAQGVEIGSSVNAGTVHTWRFETDGTLKPGSDNLQDLGTPTARIRHIYVGPGSISIGDSVITESTTGKLVLPGVTRATTLFANEVEDSGDQTTTFTSAPTLIDAYEYSIRGGATADGAYVAATYTCSIDSDGELDDIEVDAGGTWTQAIATYNRTNDMYAYTGSNINEAFNASNWTQIPFNVRAKANDVEYEFNNGGGGASALEDLDDVQLEGPVEGSVLTWDANEEKWVNRTPSTNANTGSFVFSDNFLTVNTGDQVVIQGQTDGNARIDIPNDDWSENSKALTISNTGAQGVKISTGQNADNTWTFGQGGTLVLPEGGDIVDSTGTSVLGGGSGATGFDTIMVDGEPAATADGTTQFELVAGEGISITSGSNNQITISAASNASPQYGYFTELSNTADSNRVNGEAVAMDSDGNSYVSYSYYNDNNDRDYGGVAKFSGTGTKIWSVDISSQNGDARYPEICSLEYSTLNGEPVLIAFGNYYDNNTNKDVAIMYAINPATGEVGVPLFDAEITSDFGMELKDGVVGLDGNNNPFSVVVGSTYDQKLTKTLTPLAGSTVDKVYFSWSDVNAAGLQNNDQLIYNVGGYAGLRVNAVETTANPAGSTDPSWYGLSLTVSATESGSYVITRVNGWGGALNSWPAPQTLTVLGSVLGGVDGVNDMTFDFDNTVFNNDSNNINAAASNIQGTPVSNVYCQAWNGKDWSTEIGNPLTFEYNLNNQAFIARFGSNEWTKNVGTTDYDRLNSVAVDSDGNAYAAGYAWNNSRGSLVAKYDIDGDKQWAVYIDPASNTGNELTSLDLLPGGDIITVDEEGTVTKLNKTDGSIIWQVTVDNGPSWDGNFRGTATPDGDYILANHEDNDYTLYVMRVSGSDGSSMWTKRITRTYGGSDGQINVEDDFDAQFIDCNATYVTIAANTEPNSGNETGLVISFPIDGQNVDGTYGQYVVSSEDLDWTTESTGSITASVTETPTNVTVNELSPSKTDSTFTANKTNIGGEEEVAAEVITWTNPNNNTWRIETYNGGAALQYWSGDDQSAKWFDIANHTSGSGDFRGAIIQYHAFIQNRGTIIGTIHLTNDYTQEEATHTEHLSGHSDLQFVTLWKCNNERGQLFFKMTNEQNWQAMIQWTSTVFYGQEFND